MIELMWKTAEPSATAQRGNVTMGTRGLAPAQLNIADKYNPQVRPTKAAISTNTPNFTEIASDWKVFQQIERTNAVTFRGDTRPPKEVISVQNGFGPPDSRNDRYYLENGIYDHFSGYLQRRYNRTVTKQDFLSAVDRTAFGNEAKALLVDYMMWRKICEREAVHLGRMVEQECLKGYISTARCIDTAIQFGTRHNSQAGWMYVTVVHGGFIVPWEDKFWGSGEAEIAQWGRIPGERIVGFRYLRDRNPAGLTPEERAAGPDGPIYIRKSFRKAEPKAFETIFNYMSGKTP
jgi:hypothetical protein